MKIHMLSLLSLLSLLPLAGCGGGGGGGASCASMTPANRPKLEVTWELKHGSMDDDPPRQHVKLVLKGAATDTIDLGELVGACKMQELGAVPEGAVAGLKVTELACPNSSTGRTDFVALVIDAPGKLVLRKYRRQGEGPIQNQSELKSFEVPSCTQYAVDIAQGGSL